MEKSDSVYVVLGDFVWADLGSWQGLHELQPRDSNNNVIEANALLYDTKNSFIKVSPEKLVVVQGLDNYLINESRSEERRVGKECRDRCAPKDYRLKET